MPTKKKKEMVLLASAVKRPRAGPRLRGAGNPMRGNVLAIAPKRGRGCGCSRGYGKGVLPSINSLVRNSFGSA